MPGIPVTAQGQSLVTEIKQRGLASAFSVNLRIFRAKFGHNPRATYLHVDLNAGGGINEQVGCIGSPLAFLEAARREEVQRFHAVFCDISKDAVCSLLRRDEIDQDHRAFVVHGDNAAWCSAIPHLVDMLGERREFVVGSVLADPNGTDVPSEALATLAQACPRLDIMVNIAATGLKRNGMQLGDVIKAIDKRHWLIREPIGKWQWTMLIGRNVETAEHRALGFHGA